MPVLNKNEIDGPPAITVDLTPSAPAGQPLSGTRWYQSEWTTDPTLFANAAGRTASNFWTAGTFLSQVRKFTVALPKPQWNAFGISNRHIYFRVGSGTSQNIATWAWSVITDIVVNHMPVANAGAPQSKPVTIGGTIASDVILDGTASSDSDAGSTLTYAWKLKSPPASCFDQVFLTALRNRLGANTAQVTAFPVGTAIPLSSEGTYVFTLEVRDDDPPSFKKNTIGKDDDEVRITLGSCLKQIRIDAPTSASPARRIRPAPVDVEIAWRMDPALHQQLQVSYLGNHLLKLFITDPLAMASAPPIYTEFEVPVPQSGLFIWSGTDTNAVPVGSGSYDVRIALLDALNNSVTIPGFSTEAVELAAIVIDGFTARIDATASSTFLPYGAPALVTYEVTAPEPPDEITLVIQNATGTARTSLTTLVGSSTFAPPLPGQYSCAVEVKRLGQVVTTSNVHEVWSMEDPLNPALSVFPVGMASYDATTDPLAPAATRSLTLPPDLADGFASPMTVGIHALVRYPASISGVGAPINTAQATYPLVLIVHGNHAQLPAATGSYLAFDYLATHLAAQGFIAVSVEMEPLQSMGNPSISHRAKIINAHLERWLWKSGSDPLFGTHVDLAHVGLVGHSRGGEAVIKAISLGTPAGITVGAIASMAPTDLVGLTPIGRPYLCLYGSADGDVYIAMGFRLYDRADRPKAQVFLYGATHNDFCDHPSWLTERAEPAPSRILARGTVQAAAKAFVAAFLQWNLYGRDEMGMYFDAQNTPPSLRALAPNLVAVKSLELAATLAIDRFEAVPSNIATTDSGLVTRDAPLGGLGPFNEQPLRFTYPPLVYVTTPYVQQDTIGAWVGWNSASAYVIELADKGVAGFRVVTFRVAQALSAGSPPADPKNPLNMAKKLRVTLVDTDKRSGTVDLASFSQSPPYPYVRNDVRASLLVSAGPSPAEAEFATKSAFMSARVPLWAFKTVAPKLDLAHLDQLRILLDDTGLVVLDDIEFSL